MTVHGRDYRHCVWSMNAEKGQVQRESRESSSRVVRGEQRPRCSRPVHITDGAVPVPAEAKQRHFAMSNCCQWFVGYSRMLCCITVLLVFGLTLGCTIKCLRLNHRNMINMAINEKTWVQIKDGMSRQQVIDMIGDSGGKYNRFPVIYKGDLGFWDGVICERYNTEVWTGDEGELRVCFDEIGVVRHSFYRSVFTDKRSMIERFLDWLRSGKGVRNEWHGLMEQSVTLYAGFFSIRSCIKISAA